MDDNGTRRPTPPALALSELQIADPFLSRRGQLKHDLHTKFLAFFQGQLRRTLCKLLYRSIHPLFICVEFVEEGDAFEWVQEWKER